MSVGVRINEFLNDTKSSWYIFGYKNDLLSNKKVILRL